MKSYESPAACASPLPLATVPDRVTRSSSGRRSLIKSRLQDGFALEVLPAWYANGVSKRHDAHTNLVLRVAPK